MLYRIAKRNVSCATIPIRAGGAAYSPKFLQRFAVILDHATSLAPGCFFGRLTRKITVPLKYCTPYCTPRSRPLGSTSLQPAVRRGVLHSAAGPTPRSEPLRAARGRLRVTPSAYVRLILTSEGVKS